VPVTLPAPSPVAALSSPITDDLGTIEIELAGGSGFVCQAR